MLRYTGKGWIKGVPARDLTEDEAKLYGKTRLLKSGLYLESKKKSEETAERPAFSAEER